MNPVLENIAKKLSVPNPIPSEKEERFAALVPKVCWGLLILFFLVVSYRLTWDVPGNYCYDGAVLTDEGFYSADASNWYLEGELLVPMEHQQIITLPVLQVIQMGVFSVFGYGLFVLRVLNLVFLAAFLAVLYLIFRRFVSHRWAMVGLVLICLNHVMYYNARLAVAELPMAFFISAAVACAVYSRGRYNYLLALLATVFYTLALFTKANALFFAPMLALVMVFSELDWKKVIIKFFLCSSLFAFLVGLYYLLVIRHNLEAFAYFFQLNVGVSEPFSISKFDENLEYIIDFSYIIDPIMTRVFHALPFLALLAVPKLRRDQFFWLGVAWGVSFLVGYIVYGRIYIRFYTMLFPAYAFLLVAILRGFWQQRQHYCYLLYVTLAAVIVSTGYNLKETGGYLDNMSNGYNELADDLKAAMEEDGNPDGILMGHQSASVALRAGVRSRYDRYSRYPMIERLEENNPSYYITEGIFRMFPYEMYYMHFEALYPRYSMELIGRYSVSNSVRGMPLSLYRLIPWDEGMVDPDQVVDVVPREAVGVTPITEEDSRFLRPFTYDLPEETPENREDRTPVNFATGGGWETSTKMPEYGVRYGANAVSHNGLVYFTGGLHGTKSLADVWVSANSANWHRLLEQAPWDERFSHQMVSFNGRIWLIGGIGDTVKNDVWSSEDGMDWELMTPHAEWEPRTDFQLVVHQGKMLVIGGLGMHRRFNDVWASEDGVTWKPLTENAAWEPRDRHGVTVLNDELYLVGGATHLTDEQLALHHIGRYSFFNDVWKSGDGINWELVTKSASFSPRSQHHLITVDNRLLLIDGNDDYTGAQMPREAWVSEDGEAWHMLARRSSKQRRAHRRFTTLVVHDGAIWELGGANHQGGGFWESSRVFVSKGRPINLTTDVTKDLPRFPRAPRPLRKKKD